MKNLDRWILTQTHLNNLRISISEIVWGGDVPSTIPEVIGVVPSPFLSPFMSPFCVKLRVRSGPFESFIYRFGSGSRLFIACWGHSTNWNDSTGMDYWASEMLARGWTVCCLPMPGLLGNVGPTNHDFSQYHNETYHPFRAFLDPVVSLVSEHYPGDIAIGGVSGGGWTAVLAAALDQRINKSISVAGSLPLWLRNSTDQGDWEQREETFFTRCDYLDLYAMANNQLAVYNHLDNCCFAGQRFQGFASAISKQTDGRWKCYCDPSNPVHSLSHETRHNIVIPFMEGIKMPQIIIDSHNPSVIYTGNWSHFEGQGYAGSVKSSAPASASVRFNLIVPSQANYTISLTWTTHPNRATNARVWLKNLSDGSIVATAFLDQRNPVWSFTSNGFPWKTIFNLDLSPGNYEVVISNEEADGYIIADAVMLH